MKRSKIIFGSILFLAIISIASIIAVKFFGVRKLRSNTIERTLAIIKPDAVRARYTGKIIDRIELEGYTIVDLKKVTLDREQVEKFYSAHKSKTFFNGLVDFMVSGPIVVMILEKINALADWRDLIGTTDPQKAKDGTLRKQFGTDIRHNALHGSANHAAGNKEIKFFFADRIK
jgi:nucleoside-diphosphate kinase